MQLSSLRFLEQKLRSDEVGLKPAIAIERQRSHDARQAEAVEDTAAEALGAELARTVSTIDRILTDAATPARLYDVLARRRRSTPPIADPTPNQPVEIRALLREVRAEVLRSLGWNRPAADLGPQSKPLLTRACKKLITSWIEAPEAFDKRMSKATS